ncbi:hypothetical protein [Pantoea sp. CTOTU49201]|jgi:hypothetical protein|uniref:hypothetical protein n=1 Tax=Pantoea sp. CTOTU49201 TaxID=2953855 RepID=UPI0028A04317|nr:hypothetical protein [Pantoea sp. CTOTU49201]
MNSMLKLRMSAPDVKVTEFLQENNKQAVLDALERAHFLISNGDASYETSSTMDSVEIVIIPSGE